MKPALPLGMLFLALPVFADEPPRPEGYTPLEALVGKWTVSGREDTYRETCDWYHGKRHIVCHTESKREDGSTTHSISILSFVPDQGYVYTGISSNGRYETHRDGTFKGGILEYVDRSSKGLTRTRMGPFGGTRVPINVHTSPDGDKWEQVVSNEYVRVE